ncbi:trypsin beta-like [Drosophila biarmipes]|uniref:trypsin beta-like n=1 Tax=Drosophila biarmipes TaxID=125945 RepID=UPI0007E889BD|nr:trypsin beta-like [Drosophila biarmipes]
MFVQWIFLISSATTISSKWISNRILGGHSVSIESVPWQTSLQKYGDHWCGAVIYSDKIVLTAAHCTKDASPSIFSVRVGSSNSASGGQVVKVSHIIVHEEYDQNDDVSNDIAVIQLKSNLKMGVGVKCIPLADRSPSPGSSASVSGWGRSGLDGEYSENLMKTTLTIVDWYSCLNSWNGQISKDMICAFEAGRDSCSGDSGGPLVSGGKLVGLVSFGEECDDPQKPGVYANVAELKPWILNAVHRLLKRNKKV